MYSNGETTCYFLQLQGTAMGTSSACMWATIYYAVHDVSTLLPIYENNLIQLVRFIDDMFGVFVPNNDINANYIQDHSTVQFQEFVNDLTYL